MTDASWFRRTTWTAEDQSAFFARLQRSRTASNKAQYCRIQAFCLQEVGLYSAAIELLEFERTNWPERAFLAQSWKQQANCLERLGDYGAAVEAYRKALEAQRRFPTVLTQAHRDFGWLVATLPLPDLYSEALASLDEFSKTTPAFPVERFEDSVIRALIWHAKGSHELSRRFATAALGAAQERHSGFARHANLGLVETFDEGLRQRLESIVHSGFVDR